MLTSLINSLSHFIRWMGYFRLIPHDSSIYSAYSSHNTFESFVFLKKYGQRASMMDTTPYTIPHTTIIRVIIPYGWIRCLVLLGFL